MSEIASKTNTEPNASLAQPFNKKGARAEHDVLFAALFGGVVVSSSIANPDEDPVTVSPISATADSDTGSNPDIDADILASMQAMAKMMSSQHVKGRKSELLADADKRTTDENALEWSNELAADEMVSAHPMMVDLMPTQQQARKSLSAPHRSAVMAQMAFEDEAVKSHQHTNRTMVNKVAHSLIASAGQSQMAALSSPSLKTVKPAEKVQANADSIGELLEGELDGQKIQTRLAGRAAIRQAAYQPNSNQAGLATNKTASGSDNALIDMDGDMQFDSSDEFMRTVVGQTDRFVSRTNGQTLLGESLSANAVRQMQAVGVSPGGQMSQQNNGQPPGQSGGFVLASAGMSNGSIMDMLDMAQDNWTEMLLQRMEKGLAGGKDKIDFHLSPRNLGKMRISLVVQNDRTSVYIQTETTAAAQMLSDAEARLAQMMDASGLKFGNLTSQHNQNFNGNFGGQNLGQGRNGGASNDRVSGTANETDETDVEINVEQSENLVNMQA